jgi:hypothetical protein
MRFSAETCRQLADRTTKRIPDARRWRLRVSELLLVATTTVGLTGETQAQPVAVEPAALFTKIYAKDELKAKLPANPVSTLGSRLLNEVTEILKGIANAQGGSAQRASVEALRTKQAEKDKWLIAAGRMKDAPLTEKVNPLNLRLFFAGEAQKSASARATGYVPALNAVKSGFDMHLDVTSLWAGDSTPKPASRPDRYGLVLADIVPARTAYDRVSLGNSLEEMQFAGQADVHWTIGALSEEQNRKLFQFDESPQAAGEPDSLWSRIRIPKAKFNSKLRPETFDNLASLKKESMPVWRLDLAQEEGYFNLIYRTLPSGKRVSQEEELRLPVFGTLTLARRFTETWKVIQTSAYNLLVDNRLPSVSVHYMHIERRFKADVAKQINAQTRVAIACKGKATGPVLERGEGDRPEAYSLELSKTL